MTFHLLFPGGTCALASPSVERKGDEKMSDWKDCWWYKDKEYEPTFDVQLSKPEETINSAGKPSTNITVTVALRHVERLPDRTLRRWTGDVFFKWGCEMEGHNLAEEKILKMKLSISDTVCSQMKDSFLYAIHKPTTAE